MKLNFKKTILILVLNLNLNLAANCTSDTGASCSNTDLPIKITNTCQPQNINEKAYGQTFFAIRPQYSNSARDQMGTSNRIHEFESDEISADLSLALDYSQSTNSNDLGSWFFFNGTNTMKYGPNWDANSNPHQVDINSLNFAVTASGQITAKPRIQNYVLDMQLHVSWDQYLKGLWTRIDLPINYVRTDMHLTDLVTTVDANNYAPGYFNQGDVNNVAPSPIPNPTSGTVPSYASLKPAWVGNQASGDFLNRALGNIKTDRDSTTKLAGLAIDIGYDFFRRAAGHLGASVRVVAPTGNRPVSQFVFEAIAGNDCCWELGAGLTSAYHLATNNPDTSYSFYLDGQTTYLFASAQKRLLGLKNLQSVAVAGNVVGSTLPSAGATWLLLEQFNSANQYTGTLASATDELALVVKVGQQVMADFSTSLEYRKDDYGLRLGYNFWLRTKEKASARQQSVFATQNWAIKAASGNHGTANLLAVNSVASEFVAQKATSNIAQAGITVASTSANAYLTEDDITVCPALAPQAFSNKIFASFDYCLSNNAWTPYLLIALSYEVNTKTAHLKNSALSQWSLMAKGGMAF